MGKPRLQIFNKERSERSRRDEYSPIDLDHTAEAITKKVAERLLQIFDKYECYPTLEGWRALALELIEKHEELKFKQRFKAERNWFAMWEVHHIWRAQPQNASKRTQKEIVWEIAPLFGLKPQTLAVRYAAKDKKELERYNPYKMRFPDWGERGAKYAHAIYEAPRRITLQH
jgi:hypothetical protein